jgi:hypothetical protein
MNTEQMDLHRFDDGYACHETNRSWMTWQEAARQEREACAKVCDDMSEQYRDAYKGRTEPIDRAALYNPHTDGMSDGACECAHEIRERSHPSHG